MKYTYHKLDLKLQTKKQIIINVYQKNEHKHLFLECLCSFSIQYIIFIIKFKNQTITILKNIVF